AVGRSVVRRPTFNLTVADAHLFYANGVLSSNTAGEDHAADAVRYACMARPVVTRPTLELPMKGLQQLTMNDLWRDHARQLKEGREGM
ncbi:MAG TPA: hypothetical protein VH184_12545, partial [Dongiaceae bacterium]|nr:hypothetical protein [Dongiaceae bacterium]